jgi:hypothetical protein
MSINPELLVKAAFNGDNNLVESLIRSGADINAESSYLNPLHAAIENYQFDTVKLLVQLGADIEYEYLGVTPLQRALDCEIDGAFQMNEPEDPEPVLTKFLLDLGADINRRNSAGEAPLQMAIRREHKKAVGLLIERGAVRFTF